ncbi:MAG: oxidoreductase [Candidatus Thermofonsia Clade 3 bacterium]|uniref:Oxidoreductase n=1 Tax=Candidatus Thermofonsia Clade 3 bacterium TaxID=2364212 RepID=A0A2M8QBL8_9CHLR|nr:MAG: oxidoreductase [Candidatus Thermofonsia Clade 3 bacterium]
MKKLLILGAGTAGTMVANRLSRMLEDGEWKITVVDQSETHYYQPGFLFIPFGIYKKHDVVKPRRDFIPPGVELIISPVEMIETERNRVRLAKDGRYLDYDFLVIATGAHIRPDQTPGMAEHEWRRSIHDFYTLEGALALARYLRTWPGGRLVVNVVDNPIKCPVAPLEFLMLADWFFRERGMRDRVELIYATPLSGAFTKPIASKLLSGLLEEKGIQVVPDFMIERVEPDAKKIISYDEQEVAYDLLVSVPLNMGDEVVARSGLGDALNYVPVDKHTFVSPTYPNVFALGDAAAVPTSKAGSVAHFAVECFAENFVHYTDGLEMPHKFDGHANCFIESGFGKGLLIDFNYDVEPLPGRYPLPGVGPFTLLEESEANHWGKLLFRWMYWHLLLKGKELPLPALMSMAGKQRLN